MNDYIQTIVTLVSSATILLVLRQQIKSQQEQINAMKSSMESMKTYMDIFKIDEIKKYVAVMEERAEAKGQLAAQKVIKDMLNSEEWRETLMKPFEVKIEQLLREDQYNRLVELLDATIDHLALLPKEEMEILVKEQYPLNSGAIFQEFEEIEKHDPGFLIAARKSFQQSLPEGMKVDIERNRTQM